MPLTWRHWWIVAVASLGQLVGTAVATVAGIIIPMLNILSRPELSSAMQGLIGAADLIGIMIGSVVFGKLSDKYGYLLFFRCCPLLILVASVISIFVVNVWVLIAALFVIGFGIGGEYSLDSNYVSELMPQKYRKIMLGITKMASALGNILAAGIGFAIVLAGRNAAEWPDLMWIVAGIALLMFASRIYFFESPKWLLEHGRTSEAEKAVKEFLGKDVELDDVRNESARTEAEVSRTTKEEPAAASTSEGDSPSGWAFAKRYFNRVMLSGVPWACEGLGVYGIGVFIPILVMALGIEHISAGGPAILHVAESVKTTLWISCIMLPGFAIGLWVSTRKINVASLQAWGFWACAVSLTLLLFSFHYHWAKWISLLAFMMFELFLNVGPHLVTFLLPPMIYPLEVRGQGTGLAASIGKFGAVIGVFVIPVLLDWGGAVLVLSVSAAVMAIGAIVTQVFAPRVMKKAGD